MKSRNQTSIAAFVIYVAVAVLTLVTVWTLSPLPAGDIRSLAAIFALLMAETIAWKYVSILLQGGLRSSIASFAAFGYVVATYWLGTIIAACFVFLPSVLYLSIQALLFLGFALAGGILYLSNKHISGGERRDDRLTSDWDDLLRDAQNAKNMLMLWGEVERRMLEREIDQLVDSIRFSDPVTVPELASVEYTIQIELRLLTDKLKSRSGQGYAEQSASVPELRRTITGLENVIKQRNQQLIASKG
ncbi:hypothetical protein ACX1C1_13595 [Paenibacillus sp. strain BS8-2]